MKILVVDIAASEGGALTILYEYYYKALKDQTNEYIFWVGNIDLPDSRNIKVMKFPEVKNNSFKRLLFDFGGAKKKIEEIKPDEIVSLQNTCLYGIGDIPQTIYVHQPLPFQSIKNYSLFKKSERTLALKQHLLGKIIFLSCKKASKIIVQTRWMKLRIVDKTGIETSKIQVQCPDITLETSVGMTKEEYGQYSYNHFVYPCSNIDYKNINIIYEAVSLLKASGIEDFDITLTVSGRDTDNIKHIGRIDRDKLMYLMSKSVMVFPSYIETVGLPLLEAKKLGTVVLASDLDYAHEALADYEDAHYFNPFDAAELADLMKKVITKDIVLVGI